MYSDDPTNTTIIVINQRIDGLLQENLTGNSINYSIK